MMSKCGFLILYWSHIKKSLSQEGLILNSKIQGGGSRGWNGPWKNMKKSMLTFSLKTGSWSRWLLKNSVGKPSSTSMRFCPCSTFKLMFQSWSKYCKQPLNLKTIFKVNLILTNWISSKISNHKSKLIQWAVLKLNLAQQKRLRWNIHLAQINNPRSKWERSKRQTSLR